MKLSSATQSEMQQIDSERTIQAHENPDRETLRDEMRRAKAMSCVGLPETCALLSSETRRRSGDNKESYARIYIPIYIPMYTKTNTLIYILNSTRMWH